MTQNVSSNAFLKLTGVIGGVFLLINRKYSDIMRGVTQTELPMIDGAWIYTEDGLVLDLSKLPELSTLGGAVRIEGKALPNPILVVLGEDGNYYAFKNVCKHIGRMIDPVVGTRTLRCTSVICKTKSTYDYKGKVLSGLAEEPLTTYQLSFVGNNLTIFL